MYNKILNPKTNRYVNVNTKLGKYIIQNYVNQLNGGMLQSPGMTNTGITNTESDVSISRELSSPLLEPELTPLQEDEVLRKITRINAFNYNPFIPGPTPYTNKIGSNPDAEHPRNENTPNKITGRQDYLKYIHDNFEFYRTKDLFLKRTFYPFYEEMAKKPDDEIKNWCIDDLTYYGVMPFTIIGYQGAFIKGSNLEHMGLYIGNGYVAQISQGGSDDGSFEEYLSNWCMNTRIPRKVNPKRQNVLFKTGASPLVCMVISTLEDFIKAGVLGSQNFSGQKHIFSVIQPDDWMEGRAENLNIKRPYLPNGPNFYPNHKIRSMSERINKFLVNIKNQPYWPYDPIDKHGLQIWNISEDEALKMHASGNCQNFPNEIVTGRNQMIQKEEVKRESPQINWFQKNINAALGVSPVVIKREPYIIPIRTYLDFSFNHNIQTIIDRFVDGRSADKPKKRVKFVEMATRIALKWWPPLIFEGKTADYTIPNIDFSRLNSGDKINMEQFINYGKSIFTSEDFLDEFQKYVDEEYNYFEELRERADVRYKEHLDLNLLGGKN